MKKLLLTGGVLMLHLLSFGQCDIIFVSTTGSPAAAGTMADPLDITTAFTIVGQDEVIRIATGTYTIDAPLTIAFDNVFVEGGFDDFNSWQKTSMAGATTINRSTLNAEGSANATRLVAIYANGITGFEIHDVTITTDNAVLAGSSTYGIHIENCSNYSIVRCQIFPGNGGTGADGLIGITGADGTGGGNGASGSIDDECAGGAGGTGGAGGGAGGGPPTIGGVNPGGCTQTGGNGQNGSDSFNPRAGGAGGGGGAGGEEAYNGGVGGQGGGVNGGANQIGGGAAGLWGDPGGDGGTGSNGAAGAVGIVGAVGAGGQTNTYFVPGVQAGTGTDGGGGKGGVGGGGGGGQYCGFCIDGSGNGGGGGGGGGEGGTGGTGGFGGGGSFGIYLFNNGLNGTVNNCNIVAGNSGNGGSGGLGGPGGIGGPIGVGPNVGTSEIGEGGEGGVGGNGGGGGAGGNGTNGLSASTVLASGVALTLADVTFDLAALPEITVEYVTCTAESASFKDETMPVGTGNVLWNFGANTSTQFATDNPSSTSFNTLGTHTITQGSSVYANFVNITCSVDASASEAGGTITANTAGANYIWVDCNSGFFPVAGETSQSFSPTIDGDFAVIVEQNGCSDTSACFNIAIWGIDEISNDFVRIYPNPVVDEITLEFASLVSTGTVRILAYSGKLVEEFLIDNTLKTTHSFDYPKGVYVVELITDGQHAVQRVVKQ